MIELTELAWIERHAPFSFALHPHSDLAILHRGNGAEVAVGDTKLFVWGCNLNFLADSKLPLHLPKDMNTLQPAWVIGDRRTILKVNGKQVLPRLYRSNGGKAVTINTF